MVDTFFCTPKIAADDVGKANADKVISKGKSFVDNKSSESLTSTSTAPTAAAVASTVTKGVKEKVSRRFVVVRNP